MADGVDAAITDLVDVLRGTGRHAEHRREQVGRCVHCSCGTRVQGAMAAARAAFGTPFRFEVVLADGFISYRSNDRANADAMAARHRGATVREARHA